jgi:Fe-coproporphyrin III synthase
MNSFPIEKPKWAEYTWNYAKTGIKSKILHRQPIFLTVFVTARCGLNCGHCFYREELLQGDINNEMTLEEYDLFTKQTPNCPKLIITGGEPFLRNDLVDICLLFYQNKSRARQMTIPTSGQHTNRIVDLVNRLLNECSELILEIQLSIDGIYEKHDSIRGKGQFDKLMHTYNQLRPIQDRNERLRIRFNYTFSHKTQDHFAETYEFVTKNLNNPHFDMVLVRRTTIDPDFFVPADMKKYREATMLLQQQERKKSNGILEKVLAERAEVERYIISNHYQQKRVMSNCQAGTLTAIVSEDGEVRPCEILDTSFGNLRENNYNLEQVWKTNSAKQHRKNIKKEKCFCTFETCVRTTMVFQPQWLGKTIKAFLQNRLFSS